MTIDQLDYDDLMTDPMTWPLDLQGEAIADTARRIYQTGTVVLGCFGAVPELRKAMAADYRRLKRHLDAGTICAEGFRTSLAAIHELFADNGLLGRGLSTFDNLAYEIETAILFGQMLEAVFSSDWTLDRFTADNITAFFEALEERSTAPQH